MNSANRDFSKAIMEKGKDMRFKNILIVVNDIERSRNCDHEVSLNNAMNPPYQKCTPLRPGGVHLYLISVATHKGTTGLIESVVLLFLPESVDYQRFSDRPQSVSPFRSSFPERAFCVFVWFYVYFTGVIVHD